MPTDMRPYAERLIATDPDRFACHFSGPIWTGGASWWVRDETRPNATVHEGKDSLEAWWGFWGPLGSEAQIRELTCRDGEELLEAYARTCCEWFEAHR